MLQKGICVETSQMAFAENVSERRVYMEKIFYGIVSDPLQMFSVMIILLCILQIVALHKIKKHKKDTLKQLQTLQWEVDKLTQKQEQMSERIKQQQMQPQVKITKTEQENETPDKIIDAVLTEVFS